MKKPSKLFLLVLPLLCAGLILSLCFACLNRGIKIGQKAQKESVKYEVVIIEGFECVRIHDGKGGYSYLGPLPNTIEDREKINNKERELLINTFSQ